MEEREGNKKKNVEENEKGGTEEVNEDADGDEKNKKLREWKQRILKEYRTLFYIVHDEGGFD